MPHCWSLDNGNTHTFGECWLKWQKNVRTPLYGQRTPLAMHATRHTHTRHTHPAHDTLGTRQYSICCCVTRAQRSVDGHVIGPCATGGKYTERFRKRNWQLHLTGKMPDGSLRNQTPPTHVPWTGGVIGVRADYPSATWTTDLEGFMTPSTGESIVPWRAWESREQNLARGGKAEMIP